MNPPADIQRWKQAHDALKAAQAAELAERERIIAKYFPKPKAGVNTYDLAGGFKLKADVPERCKVDAEAAAAALAKFAKADPAGEELGKRLVKWEPALRVSEWRKLPPKLLKLITPALTWSRGLAAVELVEPKA